MGKWRGLPAALDEARGGSSSGSFFVSRPSGERELAERERDFARTLMADGISVLTPSFCDEVQRRPERKSSVLGVVPDTLAGDVGGAAVREAVADFGEQLCQATADVVPGVRRVLGDVLSQLTIGPALDFAISLGLPPRILQPRFVVVAGPGGVRVATLAFVGEPLIGDKPSEQRTPYLVRLLTDDLLELSGDHLRMGFVVRAAAKGEKLIGSCLLAERGPLRVLAQSGPLVGGPAGLGADQELAHLLVPSWHKASDRTVFNVHVVPTKGAPFVVGRRYRQLRALFESMRPELAPLAAELFPKKSLRPFKGRRLESRRKGLETWLAEVLRQSRRAPKVREHLRHFFSVGLVDSSGEEDTGSADGSP